LHDIFDSVEEKRDESLADHESLADCAG
jgi:hypothetical protein